MLSLTYVSTVSADLDADQLIALLDVVRPKNRRAGITGMLLYSDGNVIQVLEGPDHAVETVFATIQDDPRHHGIIVIVRDQIDERSFPDWSMGFRRCSRADLLHVAGVNSFMDDRDADPNATSARLLLEIFRDTMR